MSKGSKQRPRQISLKEFEKKWEAIFKSTGFITSTGYPSSANDLDSKQLSEKSESAEQI